MEAAPVLFVLGLSAAAALALESRAGAAMFGVCFGAIAGAALLGPPRRSVTVVGLGIAGIVWLVVLGVIGQPGVRSAIAHAIAGALLGWALADGILRTPGARAGVATGAHGGGARDACGRRGLGAVGMGDRRAHRHRPHGGIADTIADLIADVAGAAAGGALAVSRFGAPSTSTRP